MSLIVEDELIFPPTNTEELKKNERSNFFQRMSVGSSSWLFSVLISMVLYLFIVQEPEIDAEILKVSKKNRQVYSFVEYRTVHQLSSGLTQTPASF